MIDKKLLSRTFILYIILLSWVILFRLNIGEFCCKYNGISLIPFEDKYNYTSSFARYACEIGNVITLDNNKVLIFIIVLSIIGFIIFLSIDLYKIWKHDKKRYN